MRDIKGPAYSWLGLQNITVHSYKCAYCSFDVASEKGYALVLANRQIGGVYVCPYCKNPTFLIDNIQKPGAATTPKLDNIPENIMTIYNEALDCIANGCYTATTMLCRKIIMNVAVNEKADKNESFAYYVNYLEKNHYIPPKGLEWIDKIRKKGNEATHEIESIQEIDAKIILSFVYFFLIFLYEMPYQAEGLRQKAR